LISQRTCTDSECRSSLSSLQLQQIEVDIFNARNLALKEASDGSYFSGLTEEKKLSYCWGSL